MFVQSAFDADSVSVSRGVQPIFFSFDSVARGWPLTIHAISHAYPVDCQFGQLVMFCAGHLQTVRGIPCGIRQGAWSSNDSFKTLAINRIGMQFPTVSCVVAGLIESKQPSTLCFCNGAYSLM
jgi:hypothetical protein